MYWYTGVLGILMIIAPFVMDYSSNPTAMWTSIILGVLAVVFSIIEARENESQQWEYALIGLFGLLALIAPAVFHFRSPATLWSTVILGGLMALVAGIRLEQPMVTQPR